MNYKLMRRLHFPLQLPTTTGQVDQHTRKLIILIYGWQPTGDDDAYDPGSGPLAELRDSLAIKRIATDWDVMVYHWEKDADTGPISVSGVVNATRSAEIARWHGYHLGQQLESLSGQQLERVHIIAHSAGSWIARCATRQLLRSRALNPSAKPVNVQVTLLDPFIPGAVSGIDSNLSTAEMGQINEFYGAFSHTLYRLENYYADDIFTSTSIFAFGTAERFAWRGTERDWNTRVDLSLNTRYDTHDGPITFYIDSVSGQQMSRPDVTPAHTASGFLASMFMNEPVFDGEAPRSVAIAQSVILAIQPNTRVDRLKGTQATGFSGIRWQRLNSSDVWTDLVGQAGKFEGTQTTLLTLRNAQPADAGSYRLKATRDLMEDASYPIVLTVTGSTPTAPFAPSNLTAAPISSSQINLGWSDNSNNETGFKLQRRPASTNSWTDLPNIGPSGRSFSNTTNLSPSTPYVYRVRAYNSAGDSPWSNEAPATTLAPAATNYTLNIASSNPTSGVSVASMLDTTGYAGATTPTSRSFPVGSFVTVTCPRTLVSGKIFQKWQLDGVDHDFDDVATVTMGAAHTLTAVYGTSAPPARTLTSLAIEGASSVDENGSATYKARASYSDGTTALVSGVDWDEDSSYADISSGGVLDAEAVSSDKSVTVTASYTAGSVTRTATKAVTIRNTASTQTYTLTRNVVGSGSIGYSPQATNYAAGTVVSLHGNEDGGWLFSHWSGDASGSDDDTTVRMDGPRTVTAHFVADTSEGGLRVNLSPPQAVAETAQWKYRYYTAWRDSGNTQGNIPVGTGYVHFKDIPGWITPDGFQATILGGQTITVNATYREIKGAVQVTITPPQAAQAGARWRLNGGAWQESGTTLADAPTGTNTLEFLTIPGWSTAPVQTITVARGVTTVRTGDYTPPAGFPIITSVAPRTGPIAGGTTVTFEGANFLPGATVTFGGIPATSVTFVSGSKITAVTPPRASYGTVPLVLTSGGQTVTQANGFSYLNPLGSNIELVGQFGGNVDAVAVVGNLCYYGEGASLVIVDFTNSSAPIERGRIALPAFIRGITISGNIAYVAASYAGTYAVNVSVPTAPSIVGFFETGLAQSVAVDGPLIYVTNATGGLVILDATNPAAMLRVGGINTIGYAKRIAIGTIGSNKYAFIGEFGPAPHVVQVNVPSAPIEVGSIPAESAFGFYDVSVVGNKLYISDWTAGLKIFDVTNPATPVFTSSPAGGGGIEVVGNRPTHGITISKSEIYPSRQTLPGLESLILVLRAETSYMRTGWFSPRAARPALKL